MCFYFNKYNREGRASRRGREGERKGWHGGEYRVGCLGSSGTEQDRAQLLTRGMCSLSRLKLMGPRGGSGTWPGEGGAAVAFCPEGC